MKTKEQDKGRMKIGMEGQEEGRKTKRRSKTRTGKKRATNYEAKGV